MDILYSIDLESGGPDIVQAIKLLEFYIASYRARGAKIIKVWHGSERSPSRAKYRAPVRAAIRRLKREKRINFFVYSENMNEENAETRYLVEKYPLAKQQDIDFGYGDDGYVTVCL